MSDTLPRNQQARCPTPLQREGAMIFPSPGPALEDAMSRPSALPPVSSVSANSQLHRTGRMDTIPVAGPGQLPPLANNSLSDARLQNAQRNLTPQPDGNNTPTACDSDPGTLSQLSSGASTVSTPTATPLAFDPDNLYKVTVALYSISDFLADYYMNFILFKAYLDARKEVEALKAENLTLRNTIAAMVVQDSATKGRKRGPQQLDDNDDVEITDPKFLLKIDKCARWCLVFRACYVDKLHFVGLDGESKFGFGDPIRFLDDDHNDMGITKDLHDAIPKKYHNLFSVSADDSKKGNVIAKVYFSNF